MTHNWPPKDSSTIYGHTRALCLTCADLDHLDYLPRGDAALTRRTRKHSRLSAVVLQWSRTRKRYERQGILAEREAIEHAEQECLGDEQQRAIRRQREQVKREAVDRQYMADFVELVRRLYPGCPSDIPDKIADHACRKHSGRVGRSAAAKQFDGQAIALAVIAWIRHKETNYDDLLQDMYDRHEARAMVRKDVESVLANWTCGPKADR